MKNVSGRRLVTLLVLAVIAGVGVWHLRSSEPREDSDAAQNASTATLQGPVLQEPTVAEHRQPSQPEMQTRKREALMAWDRFELMTGCAKLARWKNPVIVGHGHGELDPASLPSDSQCEGVSLDASDAATALKRAVDLGSQQAQRAYAQSPQLHGSPYLDIDAWRAWRDRAPQFLAEAIARGDAEAAQLHGLAAMQSGCMEMMTDDHHCQQSWPLNSILPHDDTQAYAYLLLARQLDSRNALTSLDRAMTIVAARLTDAQRAEATAHAEGMRNAGALLVSWSSQSVNALGSNPSVRR